MSRRAEHHNVNSAVAMPACDPSACHLAAHPTLPGWFKDGLLADIKYYAPFRSSS